MSFDDIDVSPGPPQSTAWIEHELRLLLRDRDAWKSRWFAMKEWAETQHTIAPTPFTAAVCDHMHMIENETPL